jgi:hypothetical protein
MPAAGSWSLRLGENAEILGIKAEINNANLKKTPFLQLRSGQAHPSFLPRLSERSGDPAIGAR